MLTPSQKLRVAVVGGSLIAQAIAIAKITRSGFTLENQAKTLVDIANKHAAHFDTDDLQALRNVNVLK